jgi:hypothetical protein
MKRILSQRTIVAVFAAAALLAVALYALDKTTDPHRQSEAVRQYASVQLPHSEVRFERSNTYGNYPYKIIAHVRSKPFRRYVVARRLHIPKAKFPILGVGGG